MICAKCGEPKAHRSHSKGFLDSVYKLFQMIPYRCHACKARFYTYRSGASSGLRTAEERKIIELRRRLKWKNSKKVVAVYSVAAVIVAAILYYVVTRPPE